MEQREFDDINRFLATVGKANLFEYFSLDTDADESAVERAIKKRRNWAQGQQSNPKYRQEAVWVIKHVAVCKRALGPERTAYLGEVEGRDQKKKLQVLRLFIMGTLADGILTARGEQAIRKQGEQLGLPAAVISGHIDAMLQEHNAVRGGEEDDPSERQPFVDYYAVLDSDPTADPQTLERAYRSRYRWARQLRDTRRASEMYSQLDEAWRVLRDPAQRARYNKVWQERGGDEGGAGGSDPGPGGAYLPPPQDDPSSTAPPKTPLPDTPAPSKAQIDEQPPVRGRALGFAPGTQPEASAPSGTSSPMTRPSTSKPPVRPSAPRPPDSIAGRSLDMGAGSRPTRPSRGPKLTIDGATERKVKVRQQPVELKIVVRNSGQGKLGARIFADREWVTVSPTRLDPTRNEHELSITVHPSRMPRKKTVSLVTVVTDHGERRAITIEAEQKSYVPLLLGALGFVGLIAAVVVGVALIPEEAPPPPPTSGRLNVQVDPPAGEVYLNETLLSSQGFVEIDEGVPADRPFTVRVDLDGFAPWSQETQVQAGELVQVRAELTLVDPMTFTPTRDQVKADVDMREARSKLKARRDRIRTCFAENLKGEAPGFTAVLEYTAFVSPRGYIVGVQATEQNFSSAATIHCIHRQLRSIRLPLVRGDYGEFNDSISFTVPSKGDG